MNEKSAYILSSSNKLLLIESPNILLEITPYELHKYLDSNPESIGYNWGYRDSSNNIIETMYPCLVSNKKDPNDRDKLTYTIAPIDKDFASKINLLQGSKLTYSIHEEKKLLVVEKINGKSVGRPIIPKTRSSYPNRMIPIDNWGFTSMRIFSLLAPIGYGQCNYLVAPGNCGKTSILLEVWESLLRLTNILPDLYVVFLVIGERKKDASLYLDIQDNIEHDRSRVEFYSASSPDTSEIQKYTSAKILQGQWRLFDYLSTQRVTSLADSWDCFYGIDSLHRAAAAHSFGNMSTSTSLMGGGFKTESLFEATTKVTAAGNLGGTSLTTMSTLIGNYNRTNGKPSVLENISRETSDHVPDSVWSLNDLAMHFPKVDLDGDKTHTRRDGQFAPKELLKERDAVKRLMWSTSKKDAPGYKAEQAHQNLIDYCTSNAIPKWAISPPDIPITPKHLEATHPNDLDRVINPIAYLTSQGMAQKLIELAKNTGMDVNKIIENALKLYNQSLEMNIAYEDIKFFLGTKPDDVIIEVLLQPDILAKKIK